MLCPVCQSFVKKRSSFCSTCGHQLPVMVGVHHPFGIRFPDATGKLCQAAVNKARAAPCYAVRREGAVCYHVSLFDRTSLYQLADLYALALKASGYDLVEHTTDGRHFFSGPSFWRCLAERVGGEPAKSPAFSHWGMKCHSLFGCLAAQQRQHEMYHREGLEVFYHGRHGIFPCDDGKLQSLRHEVVGRDDLERVMDTTTFYPDREKIRAEVLRLIQRAGCHRCPCFSARHLEEQVKAIPLEVRIGETPGWQFVNCQIHGPGVAFSCYRDNEVAVACEVGVDLLS